MNNITSHLLLSLCYSYKWENKEMRAKDFQPPYKISTATEIRYYISISFTMVCVRKKTTNLGREPVHSSGSNNRATMLRNSQNITNFAISLNYPKNFGCRERFTSDTLKRIEHAEWVLLVLYFGYGFEQSIRRLLRNMLEITIPSPPPFLIPIKIASFLFSENRRYN